MWRLSGGLLVAAAWAQIAGGWSYDFLNVAPTARVAALGGIAFPGEVDIGAAFQNPALLRRVAHRSFQLTVQPYIADITLAHLSYAHEWSGIGTFWAGLQYLNYGQLRHTDELGNILGAFSAYEGALAGGAVRHFGRWHAAMNLKFPFSVVSLERYRRAGIATDIGISYEDTTKGLAFSFVARSIGAELYRPTGRAFAQPFPTSLQTTASYKLPHAPFRLHFGLIHLERWRMAYNDPFQPVRYDLSGNPIPPPPPKWTEHLFRHIVAGVELVPGRSIAFRMGYHVQRRRELNPVGTNALGGMSFGVGLNARRWSLSYGYMLFFRQVSAHSFSLTVRPFRE